MITSLHTSKYSKKRRKEKHWIPSHCPILVMPLLMCFTEPKEQQSCISGYHGKKKYYFQSCLTKGNAQEGFPPKSSVAFGSLLFTIIHTF